MLLLVFHITIFWALQHSVQGTVCAPARALSPQCGQGHGPVCCPCRAAQEPVTLRSPTPQRAMDVCAACSAVMPGLLGVSCDTSQPAAPWAECSPEPQMPSAHVSHIPIVFSPLQVLQFPVRAMCSLAEANQYAPGPLSYKIPTYLKRGWGAQTFSSDPAL